MINTATCWHFSALRCLNARKRALPAPEAFDRHVGAATYIIAA